MAAQFLDYLYVSLTNAMAFSPTDTMPLTPMAKGVMGIQSIVSLDHDRADRVAGDQHL